MLEDSLWLEPIVVMECIDSFMHRQTFRTTLTTRLLDSSRLGIALTIEPMINEGTWKETIWPDDWTAVTLVTASALHSLSTCFW